MDAETAVPITAELIAAHGPKPDEYRRILDLIGREPSFTELGIIASSETTPSQEAVHTMKKSALVMAGWPVSTASSTRPPAALPLLS